MPTTQSAQPKRTRSTRGVNTNNIDRSEDIMGVKRERRIRSSTRTSSTRRVTTPTRTADQSVFVRTERRVAEWLTTITDNVEDWYSRQFKSGESEVYGSRAKVNGEQRAIKRSMAPVQFVTLVFFLIVVSVFSFGLLRGGYESQGANSQNRGSDIHLEEKGTTSTNTGILRGQ
ncbi:hypothetical protein HXA34_20585 [Salipaludibacillus agaradhaerens]|jgi:hypothetical protein|uniref:hypothetical protein n=1 Tax=Salipaludibacillus agaradhaerens TaxID=76935 RepID=UPI002150D013|nr:hypothetical protein [Salipaludibacillus agaradhaerens]MCR6108697.1 hypothetical protein [Salipaludibacillus agaradhaerens]MCR6120720.1 hypothetical protein [Salipaludibacillus agaradhaerens]